MSNELNQPGKEVPPKGTLVSGDFIIDQHIYEGGRYHYADRTLGVLVKVETGGAGKLANLLKKLFELSKSQELEAACEVVPARIPPAGLINGATGGVVSMRSFPGAAALTTRPSTSPTSAMTS